MDTQPDAADPNAPQKPLMAERTADEANAAQREAYERARRAAHAPRSVSSKKSLLYAYIAMALSVIVLMIVGAVLSGVSGAIIGLVGGIIIVGIGGIPIWLASGSYHQERKTGRRL